MKSYSCSGMVCNNCIKLCEEQNYPEDFEEGIIKFVSFLDGTSFEYCEKCGYKKLHESWKREKEGVRYHRHSKRDYWHKEDTKHKLNDGEFLNLDDWKKRRYEKPKPKIITPEMKRQKEIRSCYSTLRWQKKQIEKNPQFYEIKEHKEMMEEVMRGVREELEQLKAGGLK